MKITNLDHLVLTVNKPDETLEFYTTILGMEPVSYKDGRKALRFGKQQINLHEAKHEILPHAKHPCPGSADLCFIIETPLQEVIECLISCNVSILEGPVRRNGAASDILSLYIRDPDGNLIEISNHIDE